MPKQSPNSTSWASLNLFFKNSNDLSKIQFKHFIAHVKILEELSLACRIKHKMFYIAKTPTLLAFSAQSLIIHPQDIHPLFQKAIMDFFL